MIAYLLEIRQRVIRTMIFFAFVLAVCVIFSKSLLTLIITPLLNILPAGETLIATNIISPLCTPISLAIDAALLCTAPVFLYHIWRFILPGLYIKEKNIVLWVVTSSLCLFLTGAMAAFYIILPWMLSFFKHSTPAGVHFVPEMNSAVDFITHMLFLFGICFQIPLLCPVLARTGVITPEGLKKIRPYVIVAAFIFGMLITPPDVTSQIIVAIPCCLLYELGIFLAQRVTGKMLQE